MGKWTAREAEIRKMVADGLTDDQIGARYGASGSTICTVRKQLRIPTVFKRKRCAAFGPAIEPVPPLVGVTYVDEKGLSVTRYPARYAAGVEMQNITARAKR